MSQTTFERTYVGIGPTLGRSARQTSDGGYVVAGATSLTYTDFAQVFIVKTNASGDTLWARTYGGPTSDYGESVTQTADGGYVVAGLTGSFGAGASDLWLLKTDSSGDTIWTRTYGGSDSEGGYSVEQTSDGGYIAAGFTGSFGAGRYDMYLIKTDAHGDTLWTRTYGGSNNDIARSVSQTQDGGYIVAGETYSFDDHRAQVYLVRTDVSGDTLWTRIYRDSAFAIGYAVQQTSDGGYVIAGEADENVYLIKIGASGETQWTRIYGGLGSCCGNSVQQTSDDGYLVVGHTSVWVRPHVHMDDVYLVRTDSSGDTLWTRTYGSPNRHEQGGSVQQTSDGGYIIAGVAGSYTFSDRALYLLKTNADGLLDVPDSPALSKPNDGSRDLSSTVMLSWLRCPRAHEYRLQIALDSLFVQLIVDDSTIDSVKKTVSDLQFNTMYYWRVSASNLTGTSEYSVVWKFTTTLLTDVSKEEDPPCEFRLLQNFPNPFNPLTTIRYELPNRAHVTLTVFNALGQQVATLQNGEQEAGQHELRFDGSTLTSGVYYYQLRLQGFVSTKTFVILK